VAGAQQSAGDQLVEVERGQPAGDPERGGGLVAGRRPRVAAHEAVQPSAQAVAEDGEDRQVVAGA
jgi:hypothetical protein